MSTNYLSRKQMNALTDATRRRLATKAVETALDPDHPPSTKQREWIRRLVEAQLHRTGSPLAPVLPPLNKASASAVITELQEAAKARRQPRFDTFGNRKP